MKSGIKGIITYFQKNGYVFSDLTFTGIIWSEWPGPRPHLNRGIIIKVRKELRWFAAVLIGIAVFIIWYVQSPGYFHNRVMSPTLSSYYLQLEPMRDYRDPGKCIEKIDIDILDKGKDTPNREIIVTARVRMNSVFDHLSGEEAETVLLSVGDDLRRINQKAREEAALPTAIEKCRTKGKINVEDRLILLYTAKAGEQAFPEP